MKITEWFCRAVAAGLMPKWENIYSTQIGINSFVIASPDKGYIEICNTNIDAFKMFENIALIDNSVILRSNGKDLYSLEWRRPTEQDVGKMCWLRIGGCIILAELKDMYQELCENTNWLYWIYNTSYDGSFTDDILLADHGQITPTESDFKRIYGE